MSEDVKNKYLQMDGEIPSTANVAGDSSIANAGRWNAVISQGIRKDTDQAMQAVSMESFANDVISSLEIVSNLEKEKQPSSIPNPTFFDRLLRPIFLFSGGAAIVALFFVFFGQSDMEKTPSPNEYLDLNNCVVERVQSVGFNTEVLDLGDQENTTIIWVGDDATSRLN